MATLGKIRNRSGLLLTVIGVAMLAFILGDFMSSLDSRGGGSIYVGEVLGEDVMRQTYELKVEEGIENWRSQNQNGVLNQTITTQIRSQIWDQYIRDLIMNNEFSKLGIDVSDDEFFELLQGLNVHPEISKVPTFQDQVSGQFDRTKVLGYLKQIDQDPTGEARTRWVGFQKYLIGLIKNSKYKSLVSSAMYVTNEEARLNFNENLQNITFNYVAIPFSSVADSTVKPTESELEEYYSDNKSIYQQDASKDVDFVVFTVTPSLDDDKNTKSIITNLKADFAIFEDFNLMARRNSDNTSARFTFTNEEDLVDKNWVELFNAEQGTVIGPYLSSQGVYRIAKSAVVQNRPDSVEARHILIATQTISSDSALKIINAIKIQVEAGADFGNLAQKSSDDKGSAIKGGDLGWFSEGAMVDEFNEACFTSKTSDLSVVTSQFGVHLIEVTKSSKPVRKVKIAFIDRNVEPSTETFNTYYSQAAQFAGKILNEGINFDSLVAKQNLVKRSDIKVTADKQSIVGLPNSREMIRWMNTSDEETVSEVFQFENSYVVAYLTKEHIKGDVPFEDIKEQIFALVLKDKKAEHIISSITGTDLADIAANNGETVVNSQRANLANLSLQGIGYEPELVGSIFGTNVGSVSRPTTGNNAVYIVKVTAKDETRSTGDFTKQKQEVEKGAATYANEAAYKVLNTEAVVKDNRSDFY
tara:strand:+ start:707 stop:2803 length:2097 start_codon:yes stop_codon:yes gene_type:complete